MKADKEVTNFEAIVIASNRALKAACDRNLLTHLNPELVQKVEEKESTEIIWSNLFINYNNQIRNGGHQQYVDNRTHTNMNDNEYDDQGDMHQELLDLTVKMNRNMNLDSLNQFTTILKDFKIKISDEQEVEEWCDEEQDYIMQDNPDYLVPKEKEKGLFDKLDQKYWNLSEQIINEVGSELKQIIKVEEKLKDLSNENKEDLKVSRKTKNKL